MAYPLITEKQTFFYQHANGNWVPASGYKLFVYLAGTTTKATIHKETDESSQHSNPIQLNQRGEVDNGLYVAGGSQYKLVLAPSTDTDPPSAAVWTRDELTPINDTTVTVSQWQASGYTPTYVSGTSFTVTGDRTSTFQVGQRVKTTNTGGTIYGRISASAYTSLTTVTIVTDSGSLDAGLSVVEIGLLTPINPSTPILTDTYPVVSGSSDKSKLIRIEADGLTTATTRVWTAQDKNVTVADILDDHGQCQLQYVGTTSIKLVPKNGNKIVINGVPQTIPSAGVTLANTGLTAATLYYIYAYMNSGTMTLEASATTHATDTTTGVEIKNGDATRTLVGMVYMGAGTPGTFVDSVTQRFVASWFHRRRREMYANVSPGTKTNTSVAELSSSLQLQFVTWADEAWDARTFGTMYLVTAAVTSTTYLSYGIDSTSSSTSGTEIYLQQNGTTFSTPTPAGTQVTRTSSEGYHFVTPLNRVSGNTHTYDVFNAALTVVQ